MEGYTKGSGEVVWKAIGLIESKTLMTYLF